MKRWILALLVSLLTLFASENSAFAYNYYLEMGGIPATMATVGETCGLPASLSWGERPSGLDNALDDATEEMLQSSPVYAVLVLDLSGSMYGPPLDELRKAAASICKTILDHSADNRVGIVGFGSGVHTVSDLTDDIDGLTAKITSMDDGGGTTVAPAIQRAALLLEDAPTSADKNIFVLSDGMPFDGPGATAAAQALWPTHSIRSFGFFHSLTGSYKDQAVAFLESLENEGYYDSDDPQYLPENNDEVIRPITSQDAGLLQARDLALVWGSTRPSVARVTDQYGEYGQYANLVSLSLGTTNIYVSLVSIQAPTVPLATVYTELEVRELQRDYTNIHPEVARSLGLYNTRMSQHGEQLGFSSADPANVEAQSFQSAFTGRYGVSAAQVTEIGDESAVALDTAPSFTKNGYEQIKPSMRIAVSSLASGGGSLLPVAFTYDLSWSEVSGLLGREVTSLSDYGGLFGKIGIALEDEAGAVVPVIDESSYARAMSAGVLRVTGGSDKLTLTLDTMLADVNAAAGRAELIDGSLVVPDGRADGTSGGSMWLVKRAGADEPAPGDGNPAPGGDGQADSGGGGCDAGAGGLLLAALGMAFGFRRR